MEHLAPYEGRLGPGTILLLRTGWDAYYDDKAYFSHPFLDGAACARLLELGVRTICIDAINLDETPDDEHPGEGFPVHHQIARAGGVIGENFRGLDRIEWEHPSWSASRSGSPAPTAHRAARSRSSWRLRDSRADERIGARLRAQNRG